MSLDLIKVASQVKGMIAQQIAGRLERQEHLNKALETLHEKDGDFDNLKKKIENSRTTWLVARLVDGLECRHKPEPIPKDFTVVATDGSHIDVDRHRSTRCCLINIGTTVLEYGTNPACFLDSAPVLYAGDKDLVIKPVDGKGNEQLIEGGLLGIKRSVEEIRRLFELAATLHTASQPTLALLDGSLILWGLEAYPEFVSEAMLDKGFVSYLDEIKKLGYSRRLAVASYVSFPRSTDVVNALRVALCPYEPPDCDRYCPTNEKRECDVISDIRDRDLFHEVLEEGERSAIFVSPSRIQKRYGANEVYFFYLRAGDEIARVEVPRWVAEDDDLLALTHTLIFDQCRRGHGYPVALSEAHEKAVVTNADKENFWRLVEELMVEEHLIAVDSAKSRSKRTRWV